MEQQIKINYNADLTEIALCKINYIFLIEAHYATEMYLYNKIEHQSESESRNYSTKNVLFIH